MIDEVLVVLRGLTMAPTTIQWEVDHLAGGEADISITRYDTSGAIPIPSPSPDELKELRDRVVEIRRQCDELFKEVF